MPCTCLVIFSAASDLAATANKCSVVHHTCNAAACLQGVACPPCSLCPAGVCYLWWWLQNLPQLGVPELPDFLKPPKNLRSASFDVTYLDASMRITRGDRGELRLYLRDKPLTAGPPADYVD